MEIFIQGCGKAKQAFAKGLAVLLAKQLKCDASKKDLLIMFSRGFRAKTGFDGVTNYQGDEIIVAIDSALSEDRLLTTLAHEMVHVKQICKGQLKFTDQITTTWCGKKFVNAEHHYIDLPWELEAFSLQTVLIHRVSNQLI